MYTNADQGGVKSSKRRRGGALSTEQVIAAAMSIVDTEGVEALTIRRLAADCGLSPMAIYRYVRDKDELLDRVVDEVTAQVGHVSASGPWQDRLAELMAQARQALLHHPGVALVAITRASPGPSVARFYDRALAILDDAGLEPARAVLTFDTLLMFLFGSVLWQTPRRPTERGRLLRLAALLDNPPAHLLAHADDLAARDPDRYFEYGIKTILDGMAE